MIPLLINQSNISRDFSLQLSKCIADSDLAVIGLTEIGTGFCRIGPMKVYIQYLIDIFDHIKANKSKLINNIVLLHDAFHIGLVTGPRPAVLA